MNYFITLIIILISSSAWSRSNTKENTFDINKDGKTDLIEIVEDNRTIEIREDVNFDGTYDRKTSFFHAPEAKYFKIIEETAGKTRPSRRSSYWHDKKDLRTYSLVQLDRNNDGKWDTQYKRSSERFQKREDCNEATPGLGLINELAKFSFDVASQADEYLETKWGHRIHKSCLGNDQKDWFLAQTEQAITVGLSCLESLSKKGGKAGLGLDQVLSVIQATPPGPAGAFSSVAADALPAGGGEQVDAPGLDQLQP